ncbi:probable polygalacturonase At3g15720 [Cynara cardunculus var. scolymus]|uniref:probable polygalacturonase At3g15720 n=1 Tax=Cynara cardunculus var. scolymus TaxID=59895 RepID=UPI000D629E03|nr:probable polygalacturonase At3g15720 [Cynara cardunculus var. scolymus]
MSISLHLPLLFTFSLQDFLTIFVLSLCYIRFGPRTASSADFDVTSYGAKGDGNTDDSEAFVQAWADLRKDESPDPTLVVPSGMTFLISPVAFKGPCNFPTIHIKLLGDLTAPKTLDGWNGCTEKQYWIHFSSVKGLMIDGPGQFDGQGSIWWGNDEASTETCHRPSALHFHACDGLRLKGTTHINSPKLHISINGCQDVDVGDLRISAPKDSPNTDGIDINESSHVNIHDSNIQTGDDCVAINGGVYDLNVTGVFCGPGHGISIGSLGEKGGHDTVEQVRVENCNITGTQNGLRIKTVPYGTGYARGITFREIHLVNVENPIIIDQHYCSNSETAVCPSP